jgi:N-acetyl-anhydromuramyl-L-alanine amidase AmpD
MLYCPSNNHRSRNGDPIQCIVLHYTELPLSETLERFTQDGHPEVSAHYVISKQGEIFQIVDETRAAYHAGVSYWNGIQNLNNFSIGIELENLGSEAFTTIQIAQTIALCQDMIQRYDIKPYNIVGHSDIACGRKRDPGPLFPWPQLAEAGVGLWYDRQESRLNTATMPEDPFLWTLQKFSEFGYDCTLMASTIRAFQMHFRSAQIDGMMDVECMRILESLCMRKQRH